MKLPELPREHMRWDRYKAFHWGMLHSEFRCTDSWYRSPTFIVFDTQEVICIYHAPDPWRRGLYEQLNVGIFATRDSACPRLLTPDGELVPKAWLNEGGQQYLLVDYCTGRAYRLGPTDHKRVPARLKNLGSIYFPGPGQDPIAAPVTIAPHMSNKRWVSEEHREHADTVYAVCRAEVALKGGLEKGYGYLSKLSFERLLEVERWTDLNTIEQRQLYYNGYRRPRIEFSSLRGGVVKRARKLKLGQIVRVHKYGPEECDVYAIVDDGPFDESQTAFAMLLHGKLIGERPGVPSNLYLQLEEVDIIEYLTVNQIPDHIWAELAKFRMGYAPADQD